MAFDLARLDTVQIVPLTPFSSEGTRVLLDVLGSFARDGFMTLGFASSCRGRVPVSSIL